MKRFLSLLLILLTLVPCLPAQAEGALIQTPGQLPAEVQRFFASSAFNGYTIGDGASTAVTHLNRDYFFTVAQKDGFNVLYGFEKADGQYAYWLRTDSCLPQGRGQFSLQWEKGERYMLSSDAPLLLDDSLSIIFTRADYEEQADTALVFEAGKNGQWNLRLLCYNNAWDEALVTPESISYFLDEGSVRGTAYGVVETNLRYFSLSAFPRTLKEAREKLSNPPAIPSGQLKAQRIKFTGGQKFDVYTGPGAEYIRGAGGRASVSTNDWIQVFGSENGHIMIQYDISAGQMRIGYIDQSALPKSASVSPLAFEFADASITSSCSLTDDPLGSRGSLRALSGGQSVKWLAVMGNWVYVEVSGAGQPIRGFVPSGSVSKTAARKTYSASFQNSDYSAQASAEITAGVSAAVTISVTGPAGWMDAGADAVSSYQLYANNVPVDASVTARRDLTVSGWKYVFTLTAVLPNGATVLGLCPVHAKSGQNAGEMMVLNINEIK